jgi:hypothetical protein
MAWLKQPGCEADLREFLLVGAVEFRSLMVETLLEDPARAELAWGSARKPSIGWPAGLNIGSMVLSCPRIIRRGRSVRTRILCSARMTWSGSFRNRHTWPAERANRRVAATERCHADTIG